MKEVTAKAYIQRGVTLTHRDTLGVFDPESWESLWFREHRETIPLETQERIYGPEIARVRREVLIGAGE